jgi:Fe-S cluster biogenesis protein NfuA
MTNYEAQVREILEEIKPLLESHDCFAELQEVKGNTVFLYCGGEGAICENRCIEDVLKQKIPDIEIVFR